MSYGKQYSGQYQFNQNKPSGNPSLRKQAPNILQETNNNVKIGKGKDEIQEIKKKVLEVNYQISRRKRAAIKIQKVWRGYLARKRFSKIKKKLVQLKIERQKKLKKKAFIRKNAPRIICRAIYQYILKKRNKEKQLLKKYLNHCAALIQKTFRGFIIRLKYQRTKRQMKRFQNLLTTIVKGWKTRKIMKHDSMISIMQDIKDLEILQLELKNNNDDEAETTKEELPWRMSRLKRRFGDMFRKLYNSGSWAIKEDNRRNQRRSPPRRRNNQQEEDYEQHQDNQRQARRRGRSRESPRDRRPSIEQQQYEEREEQFRRSNRGQRSRSDRRRSQHEEDEYNEGNYLHEREMNAYEMRDEMPIQGKGHYNIPDEEPEDGQGIPPGRRGGARQGRKPKGPNAWEEREDRPIGGKGAYAISDDDEGARAWNERDEMPLTGKGGYTIPEHLKDEAFKGAEGEDKPKPKRQVAKKTKYDPRKAIEEAKKREEDGEDTTKNKKSEEFRNIIKNARKFQPGKPGASDEKENGAKEDEKGKKGAGRNIRGRRPQVQDEPTDSEQQKTDNEEVKNEEDDGNKKHKFLKRKTKAMAAQKLDFKKVGSRINCWTEKNKEPGDKSPERERPSTSKGKVLQQQQQQQQMNFTATVYVNNQAVSVNRPIGMQQQQPKNQKGGKMERAERQEENIPIRKVMKAYEAANQKRKPSPPKQRTPVQSHPIRIEELEKAYHSNFLSKLNHITQKFYSESGARDPEEPYNSIIPILRLNSTFFFRDDMDRYHDILLELDEEYQSLQTIN